MGRIGALTGYPATRITVLHPAELVRAADKDILAVGTLRHLADTNLLRNAPFRIERGTLALRLPSPLLDIWHLFGDGAAEERRRAGVALD